MSDVLLLNPPEVLSDLPPLGLLYVAAVLEKNDYDVNLIDCSIEKKSWDELKDVVKNEQPKIVGITATTPGIGKTTKTAQIVKEVNPNIKVVLGGPHATILPSECLKNKNIDFAIRGEGEFAFLNLVRYILRDKKTSLQKIQNLSFKSNGTIVHNPRSMRIEDLDALPWPARHFVPIKKYPGVVLPRKHPETQVMTTRGCPFNCTFCSSKNVFGSTIRFRDPVKVVDEIEYLVKTYKIKTINFYDDGLNYNPKWTIKMCDEIIERGLNDKMEWKAQVRVNKPFVTEELLRKMKEAGCWLLCWGIESGDPQILKNIRKAITLDEARRAIKMCSYVGIRSLGYFMAGNQGESIETVERTIRFCVELGNLGLDYPQLTLAVPYPGTELYEMCRKNNWLKAKTWDGYENDKRSVIVQMPDLPDEFLEKAISIFYRRFYFRPSYLLRQISKIRKKDDFILLKIGAEYLKNAISKRVPIAG